MNPLNLIGQGVRLATLPVRVATSVPKTAWHLLHRDDENGDPFAAATIVEQEEADERRAGTAPGRSPSATPGRATTSDGVVQTTAAPAEPTSAAGASGGVAGTAAAPRAAAAVRAPDPTAP